MLGRFRKGQGEWDLNQEATWFWVYEDGDWFRLPLKPSDWEAAQEQPLRLPSRDQCP